MSKALSPPYRPPWLLALASAMLLYGGLSLVTALVEVRDPKKLTAMALKSPMGRSIPDELAQKLGAINDKVVSDHRGALRIKAVVAIAVALFTLYAVAAILSRDRHGRMLALATAGVGIAFTLGTLPLGLVVAKEAAVASTPLLVATMSGTDTSPAKLEELANEIHSVFIGQPIAGAVIGLAWCALIIFCFGGRRGRALYGLQDPERVPNPPR
jgi:hypothetical protein